MPRKAPGEAGIRKKSKSATGTSPASLYDSKVKTRLEEVVAWKAEGYNDSDVARMLGISPRTFGEYKVDPKKEELRAALDKGRKEASVEIRKNLFKRAIGYEFEETTQKLVRDPQTNEIIRAEVTRNTKHIPPDVGAAKWLLQCLDPANYRDGDKSPFSPGEIAFMTSTIYLKRETENLSAIQTAREFEKIGLGVPESLRLEIRAELEITGGESLQAPSLLVQLSDGSTIPLSEVDS
jgi:hypothetical protein